MTRPKWASTQENLSLGLANSKVTDQPVHPHVLISAFVVRLLECVIYRLAKAEISIVVLVSEAEETGLSLAFSESRKTALSH